jgi:hypothetical protein
VPHARDLQLQVEVHRGPEAVRQDEERLEVKKTPKNPLKSMRDKIRNMTKPKTKKVNAVGSKMGGLFGKKGY